MTTADSAVRVSWRLTYFLRVVLIYLRKKNILHPIYYPRTTLALPPTSNSDPGSHSGRSSSLPTSARAFIFIARRIQHFLPSSTRVELYLPTLLGALSS